MVTGTHERELTSRLPAPGRLGLPALVLGCLLVPVYVWWTLVLEELFWPIWPTSVSLFYHCICGLLVLLVVNAVLRRWLPRLSFSRAELLAIYSLLSAGVAVAGHDHQMVYLRGWVYALWRAGHDPTWAPLADLPWPRYITIVNQEALDKVFHGFSTLYLPLHIKVWLIPGLFLALVLALIQWFGASLNRLMVIPWTEQERLTFPIAQLPLEMTGRDESFWRRTPLWVAFGLTVTVGLINGFHEFWPSLPQLNVKGFRLADFTGSLDPKLRPVVPHFVRTFPWILGLCFLLPKDLSLSVWVFYFFLRLQLLVCAIQGYPLPFPYQTNAVAPHIVDQGVGAYLVVFATLVYTARDHYRHAWRCAWRRAGSASEQHGYRLALLGMAGSLAGLVWCLSYVGLQFHWALLALVAYAVMVTVVCKIRGELGPPMYDLHFAGPDRWLALYVGPRNLNQRDWIGVGFLFGFNRGQRNLSLPHQLEGYWLQHQTGGSLNRMLIAFIVAGALAALTTCYGLVHLGYKEGFDTMAQYQLQAQGWGRILPWFDQLPGPNVGALGGVTAGAGMALGLTLLRQRFIGFPFHPGGFLLATNWAAEIMWFPMFAAWAIKSLVLRHGGVKAYRATLPFFLGLILGDFVIGGVWAVVGWLLDVPTYSVTW